MNHLRSYMAIILSAASEYKERLSLRSSGCYFELHHIIPKSLGGDDGCRNRVLLTAKEHYVCHHLLTKIYPRGSVGHQKMLCAWWRMATAKRPSIRPLCATEYAKLRSAVSRVMGILQAGNRNSQFGGHWYTNIDTGASAHFASPPGDRWLLGRHLFKATRERPNLWSIFTRRPVTLKNGKILISRCERNRCTEDRARAAAQELWDRYHSGKWPSLNKFCRESGVQMSVVALARRFSQYIPAYSRICSRGKNFFPDMAMVRVYE